MELFIKVNLINKRLINTLFLVLALILISYPTLADYKSGTGVHDGQEDIIKRVLSETGKKFGWDQRACFYSIPEYGTMHGLKEEKRLHCPRINGPITQYKNNQKKANDGFIKINHTDYIFSLDVIPKAIKPVKFLPKGIRPIETIPIRIMAFPSEKSAESFIEDKINSSLQSNKTVVAKMGKEWATKIINFHGIDASCNIFGMTGRIGRFVFDISNYSYDRLLKRTIVDNPVMSVAETLYKNAKSFGLIGQGSSLQDTDKGTGSTLELWGKQTKGWGHSVNARTTGNRLVLTRSAIIVAVKGNSQDYCIWSAVTPQNRTARVVICGGRNRDSIIGYTLPPGTYTVLPAAGSYVNIELKYGDTNVNNVPDISGEWKWFDGEIIHFYRDGTCSGGTKGQWQASWNGHDYTVTINWNNGQWIDKLVLHDDTLDGHNQNGTHVWGKRMRAGNIIAGKLINGNFESGPNQVGRWVTLSSGSNDLPGWHIERGSIDIVGTYWKSNNSGRSIDLCGLSCATLSQTIATIPGQTYELAFDLSGNWDHSGIKTLQVKVGNIKKLFSLTRKEKVLKIWVGEEKR